MINKVIQYLIYHTDLQNFLIAHRTLPLYRGMRMRTVRALFHRTRKDRCEEFTRVSGKDASFPAGYMGKTMAGGGGMGRHPPEADDFWQIIC